VCLYKSSLVFSSFQSFDLSEWHTIVEETLSRKFESWTFDGFHIIGVLVIYIG
jgi:hypothetical protein